MKRINKQEIPKCPVCGADLAMAACGRGEQDYACSTQIVGKINWKHYNKSKWEIPKIQGETV